MMPLTAEVISQEHCDFIMHYQILKSTTLKKKKRTLSVYMAPEILKVLKIQYLNTS